MSSSWTLAVAALALALTALAQAQQPLELIVVQYQPPTDPAQQEYYMGRVKETVEMVEARSQGNVLLVNTGGAMLTREDAAAHSMVTPDATALSLADFDKGLKGDGGLIARLTASGEKFVAANLRSPQLNDLVSSSVVTKFGDHSVGLVGYVSPYLNVLLDDDDGSNIVSEVMAVRSEVAKLREKGTHIIIAMGNAGHEANKELAKMVPGVDVVVAAPTEVAGADFPQMVSQEWHSRGIPILEIPSRNGNAIGVTRLLFNARGEMKRGVGLYKAVKEGETDNLAEELAQILQLRPEQNEVTGHSAADNKIESDAPTPAPASAPFRPRPAVATAATGEVLATADGVISGLDSDCQTKECAMGKLIADAIKWRLGGRINAAVVGSGVFTGSWHGEIHESDVDNSLQDTVVYMGRLQGATQLKQLFMQATMDNTEFMHPSGMTMNVDPATHTVSDLMVDCSICVPHGLRQADNDMPYTISFVTGTNTKPSVFQDVRDTGLSLKDDVVIPYLRRNKVIPTSEDSRITMKSATKDTDSRVTQTLSAAEEPAAPAPAPAPVHAPVRATVQRPANYPVRVVAQTPAQAVPQTPVQVHTRPQSAYPSHESMMHHLPPPPSNSPEDMLAHQQATTAYQQAVMAAVQQAAAGQSDQHYTSEQQMALAELYNSLAGRPNADGVVVQQPVIAVNGQAGGLGAVPGQVTVLGAGGQVYTQPGAGGQVYAAQPGGGAQVLFAQPETEGADTQLPAWLQAITGQQQDQQSQQVQQAGTDGVSSFLPTWLTSSDAESAAAAAADGSETGGFSSLLPSWLGGQSDETPAGAAVIPGASADESEDSGTSVAGQVLRAAMVVPPALLATSLALGFVL